MTLRGRLYLRLQLNDPHPAAVAPVIALFQAAAGSAVALRTSAKDGSDWPTTSSTAWTDLRPDDDDKR
jgi:hypothetical protein